MKRRDFLNRLALGAGVTAAAAMARPFAHAVPPTSGWQTRQTGKMTARGTARNLIFVLLEGGPSHVDTFDLKLRRETPSSLGAQSLGGGIQWPAGIMPMLATRQSQFSIVRSLSANEAVHERGVYHLTTAQRHDPSRVKEVPHFLSVMSHKLDSQRRLSDSLPTAVLFGSTTAGNGFFDIRHRGMKLNEEGQVSFLRSEIEEEEFGTGRHQLLDKLLDRMNGVTDARADRVRLLQQSRILMEDRELHTLLGLDAVGEGEEAEGNYEQQIFLSQCRSVARLLDADRGTRVIQMFLGGWDHHNAIYQGEALPALANTLDGGLAYLIDELAKKPAKSGTGTLLDETLIVAAGEFGRTTNGLNESAGRDHYPWAMSAFFAGGGIKPGRFIGATDDTGSYVTDTGWSHMRQPGIGDLVATMYSALGIDWTEQFTNTPSGRLFEMVPTNMGPVYDIDPLFV